MVTTDPADPVRHWPLAELVVRTPRLELRPDDDAGLAALADRAIDGVHPADEMPFLEPWTDDADDATTRASRGGSCSTRGAAVRRSCRPAGR